jgi:hypothetical protein
MQSEVALWTSDQLARMKELSRASSLFERMLSGVKSEAARLH